MPRVVRGQKEKKKRKTAEKGKEGNDAIFGLMACRKGEKSDTGVQRKRRKKGRLTRACCKKKRKGGEEGRGGISFGQLGGKKRRVIPSRRHRKRKGGSASSDRREGKAWKRKSYTNLLN